MARRERRCYPSGDFDRNDFDRNDRFERNSSLYVTNIPPNFDEFAVENLFCQYGNIRSVKIIYRDLDTHKSAGFVNYETSNEALTALYKLDRCEPYYLNVRIHRRSDKGKVPALEYYGDEYVENCDESFDELEEETPQNFKAGGIKICVSSDGQRDVLFQESLSERPEFRSYRDRSRPPKGNQFSPSEAEHFAQSLHAREKSNLNGTIKPQHKRMLTYEPQQVNSRCNGPSVSNAGVQTSSDDGANCNNNLKTRPSRVLRKESSGQENNVENNVPEIHLKSASTNTELNFEQNRSSSVEPNVGRSRYVHSGRNGRQHSGTNFSRNGFSNSETNGDRNRAPSAEANCARNRPSNGEPNFGRNRPPHAESNFDQNRTSHSESNFGRSRNPNAGSNFNTNHSRNRASNAMSNYDKNRSPNVGTKFENNTEPNTRINEDVYPIREVQEPENHCANQQQTSTKQNSQQQVTSRATNLLQLKQDQIVNVMVSQVDSLDEIWVQMMENSIELIQVALYKQDHLPVDKFQPVFGATYCVQYPADQAWYRGRITAINPDGTYVVLYIDYGNCEKAIKKDKIKPLPRSILMYPPQAIKCKTCPRITMKYTTAGRFSKSVLGEEMRLKVMAVEANYPIIDLQHNSTREKSEATTSGESTRQQTSERTKEESENKTQPSTAPSIGNSIQKFGHEIVKSSRASQSINHTNEKCSLFNCLEKEDEINLMWVESESNLRFWAQLLIKKYTQRYELLADLSERLAGKQMPKNELLSVKNGDIVAAKSIDGAYYRAVVMAKTEPGFEVFFIDFGNVEKVTDLQTLDEDQINVPAVAVLCTVSKSIAKSKLQTCLTENSLYVTEKSDNGITAILDCDGEPISVNIESWQSQVAIGKVVEEVDDKAICVKNNVEEVKVDAHKTANVEEKKGKSIDDQRSNIISTILVDVLPEMQPLENDVSTVYVANVANYKEISIQIEKNIHVATQLCRILNSDSSEITSGAYRGEVGHLISAKSCLDDCWYRAEILKTSETEADVLFIDYGNYEKVKYTCVRAIPEDALKIEKLAITVALANMPETLKPLEQICNKKLVDMKIIDRNANPMVVEFFTEGQPIFPSLPQNDNFIRNTEDQSVEVQIVKRIENMTFSSLSEGKVQLVVSAVKNPEAIFCLKMDDIEKFSELLSVLQDYGTKVSSAPYEPQVGEVCMAFYDDGWYRAVCLEDTEDNFMMFYLEFGYTEQLTASKIRPIDDKLYDYPVLVMHCRLVEYKDKEFDDSDNERIKKLLPEGTSINVDVTGIEAGEFLQHNYWIRHV